MFKVIEKSEDEGVFKVKGVKYVYEVIFSDDGDLMKIYRNGELVLGFEGVEVVRKIDDRLMDRLCEVCE